MQTKKEELLEIFRKGECEFVFRKANGDERQANGTLHPDYLPAVDEDREKGDNHEHDGVLTYWDLDANNWRRFTIDALLQGPVLTEER